MAKIDAWLQDLERDKKQLRKLYKSAAAVTVDRDAKLAELKQLIAQKIASPASSKLRRPNRKILVFTAFADTATYLYESLKDWVRSELNP